MRPGTLSRLRHIHRVLNRHGLDEFIPLDRVPATLRLLIRTGGRITAQNKSIARGARLRSALEDLGPIFVKFGQTLSTRRDLLPDDIAEELVKLQDRVPPFPGEEAKATIEAALGAPIDELFAAFDETPLASASVAQVHVATLFSGESVVVKVLRPGIEDRIRTDLALLFELATLADRFIDGVKRLRPIEVVGEFEKTILDELDLVREAANAADIRRRFENSEILYIPKVYFDYTRRDVMVMERISGIPVGDVAQLRREGVDLKLLAERGVEIFFTQVLRDSLFHADMHPGNIFATPDARYIAVDFGIVGSISNEDKLYIADNFRAFFNRDYRRVAELHIESGWIPGETRVVEFESAIRAVCEPIFERPLKDISYGQVLLRLFQVARRYNMEVQPQLVLLQKTLLNIEGLGRDLYPDLDLWQTAKPFIEGWFRQEIGPAAGINKLRSELPQWAQHWADVPMLAHRVLTETVNGKVRIQFESETLQALRREAKESQRRLLIGLSGSGLLISGAVLLTSPAWVPFGGGTMALGLLVLALSHRK
ncbi:MAG TPA: ubiquinone biosynthesis regulatory protein kinase UbiB [Methylococcaceae bacterium]|jgi:ubiquinone biosynthesis protein|nr:ubiquinone biosynthesis regulatory protein kinase UbiB [Methylococcaceae bacterium]